MALNKVPRELLQTVLWQRKDMSVNKTTSGIIPSLTFNNLKAGVTYNIKGNIRIETGNTGDGRVDVLNTDGSTILNQIGQLNGGTSSSFQAFPSSFDVEFTAPEDGSITFDYSESGNSQVFADGSYAVLTRLDDYVETDIWD